MLKQHRGDNTIDHAIKQINAYSTCIFFAAIQMHLYVLS